MFISSMKSPCSFGRIPVYFLSTMGGGATGLWNVTPMTSDKPVNIFVNPTSQIPFNSNSALQCDLVCDYK